MVAQGPDRADRRADRRCGGDHIRVERRARAIHRRGGQRLTGRDVCLVGRSRCTGSPARRKAVGILPPNLEFMDESEAAAICRRRTCSTSAPAARASRTRPCRASRAAIIRHVTLGPDDTVIFSSRVIPGNESSIYADAEHAGRARHHAHDAAQFEPSTSRAIRAATSCAGCINGCGRRSRSRCMASAGISWSTRAYAKSLQVQSAITPRQWQPDPSCAGRPVEVIDEVPAGRLHARRLTPGAGRRPRHVGAAQVVRKRH